jgi:hypothetical protein
MPMAHQCSDCHTAWPYLPKFIRCPECKARSITISVPRPLTAAEATDRLRRLEFIRLCSQRDAEREELGLPSPEQIGQMEAAEIRRQLAEIRELPDV